MNFFHECTSYVAGGITSAHNIQTEVFISYDIRNTNHPILIFRNTGTTINVFYSCKTLASIMPSILKISLSTSLLIGSSTETKATSSPDF